MRAILVSEPGGPEVLTVGEVEIPPVGSRDIRIQVAAAGVNRADVAQRLGRYPSPPGSPEWPGLEVSGTVAEIGEAVTRFAVGDRVCALLGGGGYAEQVVVSEDLALPVPDGLDLVDAAALPETVATVWTNVFLAGRLKAGETLLVHGGGSGIGTTAIQLAKLAGARVAVTASAGKLDACRELGADILIDYRSEDFVERVLDATDGHGADVILDIIGGPYVARDIAALATNGRILIIANQSDEQATFDPRRLMAKRGSITATTLRARPLEEKATIMQQVRTDAWPWALRGELRPLIDSRFPLEQAAEAHRRLEASAHIGKIVLTVG
ncbi:NAD(P)H-quinone oxidoreductase [Diaminobutyricimonas sp. LJ205]|uniref:NAD(P)H-quinone oxidoreductase n=1 Tax=Diaminobutyricimonas sp. LJ205 TaxID=2683590 RepID=UPI0012F48F2D|nr:NAD(P)H-quinone oxidoreductase [Diaminobutyricimonas sp. LJ205]